MEGKYLRKINNCFQHLSEEKEYLYKHIEKIMELVEYQMMVSPKDTIFSNEKELVFNYITNAVALFSALNHNLLEFIEKQIHSNVTNVAVSQVFQTQWSDVINGKKVNKTQKFNQKSNAHAQQSKSIHKGEKLKNNTSNQMSTGSCSNNKALCKSTAVNKLTKLNNEKVDVKSSDTSIHFIPTNISSDGELNYNTKQKLGERGMREDLKLLVKNEIPKGSICAISHLISPSEFYLQIIDERNTQFLDKVTDILGRTKNKKNKYHSKEDVLMNIGKHCCAYNFKTKEWLRAEVIDWKMENDPVHVEVLAVDFGYKYVTSYRYLRILSAELTNIPMLAQKCHFALLYPPESTITNKLTEWPDITIRCLRDIACLNSASTESDNTLFEVVFGYVQGDSVAVDLAQYGEQCEDTIGDVLIDMELAVEITDAISYENFEGISFLENICDEDKANNLSELIWGYEPKDGKRVCKFSRQDGTCFKGKNCKLEHIVLKDGYTTDKIPAYSIAKSAPLLINCGETRQVLITAYLDFSTMFIHIVQNPVINKKINVTMDRDLSDLVNTMNNSVVKYKELELSPHIGELVVAYHKNLGIWLRATVIDTSFKVATFKMYAVDFGFEFSTQLNQIKQIKKEFIDLSFQAMKVQLCNYQSCDTHTENGDIFFQSHVIFKNFLCHFKSSRTPIFVTMTTFKGADIGPVLLKYGFVINRTGPLNDVDEKTQPLFDLE
ncbi:hypothetical protein GWI33_021339 [Rhynchophorus ferrugineus]|uniref:Tudor domain-containing protein n=1 Tax=Rhynchophorus ferrugineus TaxID=354439 RepID=A0A834M2J4_RHYFE|nr:hypothetical protein GWI33_021339 [Rhynchophorus ferrugineus]